MNPVIERFMAGLVKRYHTQPIVGEQNVAAHSWGVAMLYMELNPNPNYEGLQECLLHDVAELFIGDTPFQTKQAYPSVAKILREVEEHVRIQMDLPEEKHHPYVKLCDMLELCMFAYYQMTLGNANFRVVFDRGINFIYKLDEWKENIKVKTIVARMIEDMNYES